MLIKFNRGSAGNTRISELALLTSWTAREGFDEESRDVKTAKALFAPRRFPIMRYGKTAREA